MHFEDAESSVKKMIFLIVVFLLCILVAGVYYGFKEPTIDPCATITIPDPVVQPIRAYDETANGHWQWYDVPEEAYD